MTRRDSKLDDALKTLHEVDATPSGDHRERLEEHLSARYRERHETSRRWTKMFDFHNPSARWAMITLAILVLGIGACSTPTTSELDMGHRLHFEIPAEAAKGDALSGALSGPQGMTSFLRAEPGVDEVNVSVSETVGGPTFIEALVWGTGLDPAGLTDALQAKYPVLDEATIVNVYELKGEVRESLAEKFGRTMFHLDIGGGSEEEMRAQILAQLKEQGFDGDAVIDVQRDGEMTTIDLELRREGEGFETEDVMELRVEGDPGEIEIGGDAGEEVTTTTTDDGERVIKKVEVKKEK